jgi:hypothetical protein
MRSRFEESKRRRRRRRRVASPMGRERGLGTRRAGGTAHDHPPPSTGLTAGPPRERET